MTDLVTTAPIRDTSKNWASSRPEPAQPDAVRIGFGSSVSPSRVRRSTAMGPPSARGGGARAAGTAAGRAGAGRPRQHRPRRPAPPAPPPARGSQPGAPNASNGIVPMSSQRICSPRNTGPSAQDRTIRVIPSLPTTGSTQVMQTPMPQAIASSTAASTGRSQRRASTVTWRSIGIGPQA